MVENRILHVKLAGGLIGLLTSNPKTALEGAIQKANTEGWQVVQVIDDNTGNLIVWILRLIILLVTLTLWTPANGYFVVLQRDIP